MRVQQVYRWYWNEESSWRDEGLIDSERAEEAEELKKKGCQKAFV